ncbi:hypothetical protein ACFU3E_00825 [Streptomyces sp. NPDC057424]|uniref:hypothetical protein n=1 Tax=Streptomyces sp. NPDC057424 TaxID=3346127 RepID=UPI0036BDAB8A
MCPHPRTTVHPIGRRRLRGALGHWGTNVTQSTGKVVDRTVSKPMPLTGSRPNAHRTKQ